MKISIFQKSKANVLTISALKIFVASWGLPGSFFGLSGDLVSNIINKEACSRKPQGSYKNFLGKNPYTPYDVFAAILENWCPDKFILSLTDLYI